MLRHDLLRPLKNDNIPVMEPKDRIKSSNCLVIHMSQRPKNPVVRIMERFKRTLAGIACAGASVRERWILGVKSVLEHE